MSAQPLVPFEEVTETTYADAFAATCTVTELRRGVELAGICPRCGDKMDFPVPTRSFLNTAAAALSATPMAVMCTCKIDHPGCPAGDEGCGAYWNVQLSRSGT
jgi:hypothetical protein